MRLALALCAALCPALASAQVTDISLGGVEPLKVTYTFDIPYTGECIVSIQDVPAPLDQRVPISTPGRQTITYTPARQCEAIGATQACVACLEQGSPVVSASACLPIPRPKIEAAIDRIYPICEATYVTQGGGSPPPPPPPPPPDPDPEPDPEPGELLLVELGTEGLLGVPLVGEPRVVGGVAQFGACLELGTDDRPPVAFELDGVPIAVDSFPPHCVYSDAALGVTPLTQVNAPGTYTLRASSAVGMSYEITFEVLGPPTPAPVPLPIPAPPQLIEVRVP